MAKRDRTQEALDGLREAMREPHSPAARKALTKALRRRSNLIVSAAIDHVRAHELPDFEAAITAAFEAAAVDGARSDPGCRTKIAAVKTLDQLSAPADALFLTGVRYVQPEPVWGGSQDTAAELRARSAMALVHRRHPEAMASLAWALADPEREVRRAAAEAVAINNDVFAGVPLLILKIRAGDPEPEVLCACFTALLELDVDRLDFVAEYLDARDASVAEAAALGLGQARPDGALELLKPLVESRVGRSREVATLAISMLRDEAAWAYLLERVREAPAVAAREAVTALAIYREHQTLRERVYAALALRDDDDAALEDCVVEAFG